MPEPISEAARLFGSRIRDTRTATGVSQQYVADRAGIHVSYLGQIERGQRNVALHNILRIAFALDVLPGVLVDRLPDPDVFPTEDRQSAMKRRRTR